MKTLFAGYYQPTKEEFDELWKNCVFVFDASVLLDLYRSTAKTREVLLSIFERIKDRIWLPYQAGWEYQENRLDVIAKERALYSELRETLNGLVKSVQQKMHNHAVESAEKIKDELERATKKIIAIIDQGASDHPDLIASDHIRDKITGLFYGKVGKKLDEKRLETIHKEGQKRYEQKIPPGYKDAEKGGTRQFGDLVIWNEILEHARSAKRPMIFITSDTKEDWWWKQGQFTIGPRPELVQEITSVAGQRFYMYNVERFLEEAQNRVDTKIERVDLKKAAEEFKEIEAKHKIDLMTLEFSEKEEEARRNAEVRERLTRLPSSEWRKVPIPDFIRAAQVSIGRRLRVEESRYCLKLILERNEIIESLSETYSNCWEIVEFIVEFLREAESKGVFP